MMEILWHAEEMRARGYTVAVALLACLVTAVVATLCWEPAHTWIRAWRMLRNVPGLPDVLPLGYGLVAHWSIVKDLEHVSYAIAGTQALMGVAHAYSSVGRPLFKAYVGIWPFVVLYTAPAAEALLSSTTVLDKAIVYRFLNSWLGTGLLTSKRDKWRPRRKLLTPAFHFRLLQDIIPTMSQHSNLFVEKIRSTVSQGPVDVVPLVSSCTLDIICKTAMGISINAQKDTGSPYVKAVNVVSGSFVTRLLKPWLWMDTLFFASKAGRHVEESVSYLHRFTEKIISSRKREYTEKATQGTVPLQELRRHAFLDLLLAMHVKDEHVITNEGIREEVDTFMFEGHDTTAMGISFTLYLLGLYKGVQDKIRLELDAIFGNDQSRPVTQDDLKEMKYLECAIKESHRLYPPVPIIARKATEDIQIHGHIIPRGTTLAMLIFQLHRDPTQFPKPEEYNPERFLQENCVGRDSFAYVPFSAGPRNCIGQRFALQEEKLVISSILRNFKLHSPEPRDTIQLYWGLVLRPQSGLRVQFLPRETM